MAGAWIAWLSVFLVLEVSADFTIDKRDMKVRPGESNFFILRLSEPLKSDVNISFDIQHSDLIRTIPSVLNLTANGTNSETQWNITLMGLKPGYSTVSANVTPPDVTEKMFFSKFRN